MLKPKVHICLLYNTATANVAPALDPQLAPQEVVLVYAATQNQKAEDLEAVLKIAGIKTSHWVLQDAWNIEHIRDRMLELLIEREGEDIALNASGGTRPMSMVAYEIFTEFSKPIFYVHPHTDDVMWMHKRDLPVINCADKIKLPAFLQIHGAPVLSQGEKRGVAKNLRKLTDELVEHAELLAKPLAALNWLAQQAEQTLQTPKLSASQENWHELQALIQRLQAEGVLEYRYQCLQFPDEEARFFVNGGWLENHTFSIAYGLRADIPEIQDVGCSVEVGRDNTGKVVKNEMDVAFLANNHLYIIECKTKRFNTYGEHPDSPGSEILYKLDTLKGLFGGVRTKAMLVSYHPLSNWDTQRARDLGIKICTARMLPQLRSVIKHWIEGEED